MEEVALTPSRLSPGDRSRLGAIVGEDWVDASPRARIAHAAGRSYLDLVALRSGRLAAVPDAVVDPADESEISAVLAACSEIDCAVVPFGGGTSVVGGVSPLSGRRRSVISLDLRRLDEIHAVDSESVTARLGAGLRGPELERRLAGHGLALDHLPQSFEYATIGGYAATRSAGQASTGVGRFEELVHGLRCVTPSGMLAVVAQPATAAGPSILDMVLGSEGTLGVITEVTAQLRRLPALRRYEGFVLRDFDNGVEALRELAQADLAPDVARLSDETETRLSLAASDRGGTGDRLLRGYLGLRKRDRGCLIIWPRPDFGCAGSPRSSAITAPSAWGGPPVPPGSGVDSAAPTCAIRCSIWASWSKPWRRRRAGRGCWVSGGGSSGRSAPCSAPRGRRH